MDNFGFQNDSDDNLNLKGYEVPKLDDDGISKHQMESSTDTSSVCSNNISDFDHPTFTLGGEYSETCSRADSLRSDRRILVERNVFTQSRFDENFGRNRRSGTTSPLKALRKQFQNNVACKTIFSCNPNCLKVFIFKLFPFFTILKDYNIRTDISGDIIAGLTVGIMHIPQGMAYGILTTLPPIYGLYMSFFPVLIYFFFGSSKHISVGTFSLACLMIGTTVTRGFEAHKTVVNNDLVKTNTSENTSMGTESMPSEELHIRLSFALSLTFMVGIFQLLMGVARLGFITCYLSDPLISGFTTGATCHVYTSQIKNVFGVQTDQYNGPLKLILTYRDFFNNIGSQIKWASLITSFISWTVLYCVTRFINHNHKFKRKMFMPVPIELIVVILGTVLSYVLKLHENYSVETVGNIPTSLPDPTSPFQHLGDVFLDAIALSVVVFAISISMAKMLAKKHNYEVDPNQELIAFGFCNIVSSFFAAPSASASMSRSLTQERAGGKTQVAGLVSCALLLIVMLAIGPYFKTLPNCVLSAIIMEKMRGMFLQVRDLKILWQISLTETLVWIVAFVATVFLDVDIGLGVGVAFALLTTLCRNQRPYTCVMGRIPRTGLYRDIKVYEQAEEIPGIKIFRCENSPLFLNVEHFRNKLYKTTVDPWKLRIARRENVSQGIFGNCRESVQALVNDNNEMELPRPTGELFTENHIMVNVISSNEYQTGCDFHTIILDCSSWNHIDTAGAKTLMSIASEYKKVNLKIFFANIKDGIRETLERTNFYTVVDRHDVYVSLHDAVQHAVHQEGMQDESGSATETAITQAADGMKSYIANGNVPKDLRLIYSASQLSHEALTV